MTAITKALALTSSLLNSHENSASVIQAGSGKIATEVNRATLLMWQCQLINSFIAASSITDAEIDPSKYTIRRQLSNRLVLYSRIVGVS